MRRVLTWLAAMSLVASAAIFGGTASPAYAANCWTTFTPSAPRGAPMTQTYKNCNGFDLYVLPAYSLNGGRFVYQDSCVFVPNLGEVTWSYSSTVATANYETAICDPPQPPDTAFTMMWSDSPGIPCYTQFTPPAPQGGELLQEYYDCAHSTASYGTAYTTSSALWVYQSSCLSFVYDPQFFAVNVGHWHFPATVQNVNYTTVQCMGSVPLVP